MSPQQLAMIAEVSEAYAAAFSVAEPGERAELTAMLAMLFERGSRTKAELMASLELEIAKGLFRQPETSAGSEQKPGVGGSSGVVAGTAADVLRGSC